MASPTARVLEAGTETDRLPQAEADSATLSNLQGELMASGLKVSGARGGRAVSRPAPPGERGGGSGGCPRSQP